MDFRCGASTLRPSHEKSVTGMDSKTAFSSAKRSFGCHKGRKESASTNRNSASRPKWKPVASDAVIARPDRAADQSAQFLSVGRYLLHIDLVERGFQSSCKFGRIVIGP